MNTFYITLAFSIGVTCVFFVLQWWFYKETKTFVTLYKDFFKRKNDYFYSTSSLEVGKENVVPPFLRIFCEQFIKMWQMISTIISLRQKALQTSLLFRIKLNEKLLCGAIKLLQNFLFLLTLG